MSLNQQIVFALIIATILTFIITTVEITFFSKSRIRSAWNSKYWFYFIIQLIGNLVATILSVLLVDKLPEGLKWLNPVLFSVAGVFAFEVVLSNTNINFFNKKVLTIQEWIYKSKASAIALATQKDLQLTEKENMLLAIEIAKHCNLQSIDTHLLRLLTPEERKQIVIDIVDCNADEKLYKSLDFVARDFNKAKALLENSKELKTKTKQLKK